MSRKACESHGLRSTRVLGWVSGMGLIDASLLDRGGPVMWILLAVSLFGFVVFVERTLFLHKSQIRSNDFLAGIRNLLRKNRLIEALTVCEETPGPVAAVVKAGLLKFEETDDRMRAAMQEAALVEIPILERRLGTLATVARVAPLLGLIGTLLGFIHAFYDLRAGELVAYPRFTELSGGVAEAMLTTVVGLSIGVMAYVAHHFLAGRVRALVHDMEFAGHQLLQIALFSEEDGAAEE